MINKTPDKIPVSRVDLSIAETVIYEMEHKDCDLRDFWRIRRIVCECPVCGESRFAGNFFDAMEPRYSIFGQLVIREEQYHVICSCCRSPMDVEIKTRMHLSEDIDANQMIARIIEFKDIQR